jgi:hypothetical protein
MKKGLLACFFIFSAFSLMFGAIQVTSPSSAEVVRSAEDYASSAFQNPWDMKEEDDLGWFVFDTTSGSRSNLTNISFANGIFSAASSTNDPNISVLDSALGISAICNLGKVGSNYKINADKFKLFVIRMKLNQNHEGLFYWSRNTRTNDYSHSGVFSTYSEWRFYIIDIPSLGYSIVDHWNKGYPWSGLVDSLRFDPVPVKADIKIDWIRLVNKDNDLYRTIRWTGNSGAVNIYLDNDRNAGNGHLGVVAKNISGKSYSLYVGALSPGVNYYIGVKDVSGAGGMKYSPGYFRVNDIPLLKFISPSEEGGEDFATTVLNNAWDMNAISDLDGYAGLSSAPRIIQKEAQDKAGTNLGNIRVLQGTSKTFSGGVGDPILYPLWFYKGRGETNFIDSSKYRILVLKMALPGAWDLNKGSVARVLWHVKGEFMSNSVEKMNQAAAFIVRHRNLGSKVVMDTIIADMKKLPLVQSQSYTGWNGLIDGFRVDPHEFAQSYGFYVQSVKLAAFERADKSYTIRWNYKDKIEKTSSLSLFYDSNDSGFNGTLIKSGITPGSEQYTWDTSKMAKGTYYIYATFNDGRNYNRAYARWPLVIDHSSPPPPPPPPPPPGDAKIRLSRTHMNFGSVNSIITNQQRFLIENIGTGKMSWKASSNKNWLTCTPNSGSGSAEVKVGVNSSGLSIGTHKGLVTVSSTDAVNSPRTLEVTFKVYKSGKTYGPFGHFATPKNNSKVSSSIPVTGWVLDDIDVLSVKIYNGSSYVGDAVFVEGARPDVEQAYPGYPRNYRAGWGYMMLTNFLPNGGNGTYKIFAKARDAEGHQITLGSKTIYVDNANAIKPFGAIDTPAQGGTASGSGYINWGWALTPLPNRILESGSTIDVYVDGVKVGHPIYNNYRSDIARKFPYYANSNGAVGYFKLDTKTYKNGVHTIQWVAKDSGGNSDGIGSRYFTISNTGNDPGITSYTGAQGGINNPPDINSIAPNIYDAVVVGKGYEEDRSFGFKHPQNDGIINISVKEMEPLVIYLNESFYEDSHLPSSIHHPSANRIRLNNRYEGYLLSETGVKSLPIGSTLETRTGIFSWMPAPGYYGKYQLLFLKVDASGEQLKILVEINITPKF